MMDSILNRAKVADSFAYMMLSRMQSDCDYFLGNDGQSRHPKHLWAKNVEEHIDNMKAIWEAFPQDAKPEWLTMEQIEDYERRMM